MRTTFNLLFLIAFYLSLCFSVQAKMGTESGGGGGVADVGLPYPVLMDFFTVIESVDLLPDSSIEKASKINDAQDLSITQSNVESIKKKNPAFKEAMTILENWSNLPNDTLSLLVLTSFHEPLVWRFSDGKISAPPFYHAEFLPADAKTSVAAYYYNDRKDHVYNVSISRPIWNQLQLVDQTGLLIHEALRQVQLGFGNEYSDETLQRATAIYMLCRPSGRLNYYMFYLLNNSPESADKIYGSFHSLIKSTCQRIR